MGKFFAFGILRSLFLFFGITVWQLLLWLVIIAAAIGILCVIFKAIFE